MYFIERGADGEEMEKGGVQQTVSLGTVLRLNTLRQTQAGLAQFHGGHTVPAHPLKWKFIADL